MSEFCFTPSIRVTRNNLWRPDAVTKTKSGKVVGNDKFKVQGFFDPTTPEAKAFFAAAKTALLDKFPGADETEIKAALSASLPRASALRDRARAKAKREGKDADTAAAWAVPEGIPDEFHRVSASTAYGPVEVVNRRGASVKEPEFFPGVWAIVQVTPNPFTDEKENEARISFYVNSALLDKPGERLKTPKGAAVPAKAAFAHIIGGTTDADPFADGPDDDIPC